MTTKSVARRALSVKQMPVKSLVPYARNARTHSSKQIGQIAASIREFGFTNPVLIDTEGGIIAGHGRVLAAQRLGIDNISTIQLSHLSDAQRRAYMLADNRLALNASWDDDLLRLELGELRDVIDDIELTGFNKKEIERLFDAVEIKQAPPELGEMEYRIVVDCTDEEQQRDLLERFEREGLQCRALIS